MTAVNGNITGRNYIGYLKVLAYKSPLRRVFLKIRSLFGRENIGLNKAQILKAVDQINLKQGNIELMEEIGLNHMVAELPREIWSNAGHGLYSAQLPIQFGLFLDWIEAKKISTYREIGVRHGGSFIIVSEIISKNNPNWTSEAYDIHYSPAISVYANLREGHVSQHIGSSVSIAMVNHITSSPVDLSFVDGDHSFKFALEDVINCWEGSRYIALHDVDSSSMLETGKLWQKIKPMVTEYEEWVDQYPSSGSSGRLMGISVFSTFNENNEKIDVDKIKALREGRK